MLRYLKLEGFKNFREARLPLGPLTVVVGTNA
jgi:AAA15 family ATPase/GTPase